MHDKGGNYLSKNNKQVSCEFVYPFYGEQCTAEAVPEHLHSHQKAKHELY